MKYEEDVYGEGMAREEGSARHIYHYMMPRPFQHIHQHSQLPKPLQHLQLQFRICIYDNKRRHRCLSGMRHDRQARQHVKMGLGPPGAGRSYK